MFYCWIEGGYAIKTPSFEVEGGGCRQRPASFLWFGGPCLTKNVVAFFRNVNTVVKLEPLLAAVSQGVQ